MLAFNLVGVSKQCAPVYGVDRYARLEMSLSKIVIFMFNKRLRPMSNSTPIELWTDGACSPNPGPGGWAYVVLYPDGSTREGSGFDAETTNNRQEMTAVIEGLRVVDPHLPVQVVTDSAYVMNPFTKNWVKGWEKRGWTRRGEDGKPAELKNADLWRALAAEVGSHQVCWRHVKGHVGHVLNERCDRLAVAERHRAFVSAVLR